MEILNNKPQPDGPWNHHVIWADGELHLWLVS